MPKGTRASSYHGVMRTGWSRYETCGFVPRLAGQSCGARAMQTLVWPNEGPTRILDRDYFLRYRCSLHATAPDDLHILEVALPGVRVYGDPVVDAVWAVLEVMGS